MYPRERGTRGREPHVTTGVCLVAVRPVGFISLIGIIYSYTYTHTHSAYVYCINAKQNNHAALAGESNESAVNHNKSVSFINDLI